MTVPLDPADKQNHADSAGVLLVALSVVAFLVPNESPAIAHGLSLQLLHRPRWGQGRLHLAGGNGLQGRALDTASGRIAATCEGIPS